MICRVAIHKQTPGSIASDEARGSRERIKVQPGFVGGYHAQDSETGSPNVVVRCRAPLCRAPLR